MPKSKGTGGTAMDGRKKNKGNLENLLPYLWKPGQSGNPSKKNIREKSTKHLKRLGYTLGEINDTLQGLLALTPEDLRNYAARPGATVLDKTISEALLNGMRKGSLYNLETILTRVYGQPQEKVEVNDKREYKITLDLGEVKKPVPQVEDIIPVLLNNGG